MNKELEKLENINFKIDDELSLKAVNELIHHFSMKHGRKLLMTNNGTERVEENFKRLDKALSYIGSIGGLHDGYKFYPCMSKIIKREFNRELNYYGFLEKLINCNNRAKGVFTEDILACGFYQNPKNYFVEFLKLMISTYRKNGFDKELEKLYYKYIGDYSSIISDKEDVKWLSKRKNQIRLYNLLAKGGTIYQKGNSIDCFKSLFYTTQSIDAGIAKTMNCRWTNEFSIKPMKLSNSTINNLIKNGYLNEKHLYDDIISLLDRDFYVPKKKSRKRTYIEDKEYIRISDSDIVAEKVRYVWGEYHSGEKKLVRDKQSYNKRYIPVLKDDKIIKVYNIDSITREKMKSLLHKTDEIITLRNKF